MEVPPPLTMSPLALTSRGFSSLAGVTAGEVIGAAGAAGAAGGVTGCSTGAAGAAGAAGVGVAGVVG